MNRKTIKIFYIKILLTQISIRALIICDEKVGLTRLKQK